MTLQDFATQLKKALKKAKIKPERLGVEIGWNSKYPNELEFQAFIRMTDDKFYFAHSNDHAEAIIELIKKVKVPKITTAAAEIEILTINKD